MPHFSPISWFMAGFIFYMTLYMFISIIWWFQNFNFSSKQHFNVPKSDSWRW